MVFVANDWQYSVCLAIIISLESGKCAVFFSSVCMWIESNDWMCVCVCCSCELMLRNITILNLVDQSMGRRAKHTDTSSNEMGWTKKIVWHIYICRIVALKRSKTVFFYCNCIILYKLYGEFIYLDWLLLYTPCPTLTNYT